MTSTSIRGLACTIGLAAILAWAAAARAQGIAGVTPSGDVSEPAPPTPIVPDPALQIQNDPYEPIAPRERLFWVLRSTIEPQRILGDAVYAAVQTAENEPKEYGPHITGFGKRAGIELAGAAVSNTMEASLGSLWGEDPRYFRVPDETFGSRVKNVFSQTFVARGRDSHYHPAYARYLAIPGSNWLSNTWRADSQATNEDAAIRSLAGFGARMASNAYNEFWPDVKHLIFHHREK